MNPRIILVNPPGNILIDEYLEPPLGLMSIASYLQQKMGIRVKILDLTKYDIDKSQQVLLEQSADIIGFTVYCTKWEIVKNLIYNLKMQQQKSPLIVVGGPNPTALPQETFAFEHIDIVVCGEGEKVFLEIVQGWMDKKTDCIERKIIYGKRLEEPEFPLLDRTLVDSPEVYSRRCLNEPVVTLEASRGCRNKCFFCNSVVMGGGSKGRVIGKKPATIMQEIWKNKQAGYEVFRFNDDSFTYAASKNGLLDELQKANIKYRIFANVNHLSEEILQKLKQSGCFHISLGIESYNPDNLRLMGKQTNQIEIRTGINRASELGISTRAYFIVGLPFDTHQNIKKYMNMVLDEVNFDEYSVYPLIPYPGTVIWKYPEKFGYTIIDDKFSNYVQIGKDARTTYVLRHTNFTERDVAAWLSYTDALFTQRGKTQTLKSKVI
jgi:anaerobic magnesium-protoporphyrin IX monomethyl ester cyclase